MSEIIDQFSQMDDTLRNIQTLKRRQQTLEQRNTELLHTASLLFGNLSNIKPATPIKFAASPLFNKKSYVTLPAIFRNLESDKWYSTMGVIWSGNQIILAAGGETLYGGYSAFGGDSIFNTIISTGFTHYPITGSKVKSTDIWHLKYAGNYVDIANTVGLDKDFDLTITHYNGSEKILEVRGISDKLMEYRPRHNAAYIPITSKWTIKYVSVGNPVDMKFYDIWGMEVCRELSHQEAEKSLRTMF